ncbi:MAG: hypothetical protein J5646_04650 [Bacteroidales bacterium]|nr:hypothetical protein [Bacteroidales bacterium]MBR4740198.1 hypothetical protein [Bacteroidales bacterium]
MKVIAKFLTILACIGFVASCDKPKEEPIPDNSSEKTDNGNTTPQTQDLESGTLPQGEFTLSAGAIYLPDSFIQTITSHDTDKCFFTTTSTSLPKPGNVLVYGQPSEFFPQGLLCKVTQVEGDAVYYEAAAIEEAFSKLQIDTADVDLGAHIDYILDGQGNKVKFSKTKAISKASVTINIPSNVTWELINTGVNYEGVEANAKMTLTPSMSVTIGLRFQAIIGDGVVEAMNFLVDPSIHLGATVNAFGELASTKEFLLYTLYFTPVTLGPLVFVPKITLTGYMKIDGQVGMEATVSYDKSFSIGAGYETGDWRFICRGTDTAGSSSNPASYSSKVEGGFSFGLKPALEFRLYDIIGAAIGADLSLRTAVSHKMDLSKPDVEASSLSDFSIYTALGIKGFVEMNAKVGGKVLYDGFSGSTPELSYTLYQTWFMPEICTSTLKIEPSPRGATITGMLKRNVLTKGSLYARVFDPSDYEYDPETNQVVYPHKRDIPITWTPAQSEKDSTDFTVTFDAFEPGTTYQVNLVMSVLGCDPVPVKGDSSLFFRTFNEKQAQAVASVVSKVAEVMEWGETPWYEVSPYEVLYMADKGIGVWLSEDGKQLKSITLTPDPSWPLKPNIVIPSSVGDALEDGQWWELYGNFPEEETDKVVSLIVKDTHCSDFAVTGKNTQHFEIHSPHYSGPLGLGPGTPALRTVDISGTGITSLYLGDETFEDSTPYKIESVKLDNCKKLEEIYVAFPTLRDVPKLSVAGCNALEKIEIRNCGFGGAVPFDGLSSLHLDYVAFFHCNGTIEIPTGANGVSFHGQYLSLSVTGGHPGLQKLGFSYDPEGEYNVDAPFESIDISNLGGVAYDLSLKAKNVKAMGLGSKSVKVYASETVEVSSCPNLETLEIEVSDTFKYSGLGAFAGLPKLTYFELSPDTRDANGEYICDLTGIVPSVVDAVRERGGSAYYPVRYTYVFDRDLGENGRWRMEYDNKYGFYYSGEPNSRCYHYPKPDYYDDYNN